VLRDARYVKAMTARVDKIHPRGALISYSKFHPPSRKRRKRGWRSGIYAYLRLFTPIYA